jgi:EAL domain-containing protein (putative c-di-GMP-specific phosphodiesterase class I)
VLDAADALGRSTALGRHLRGLAAAQARAAPDSGALFVNLHPDDILDDALLDASTTLSALRTRVVLEVTERAAIKNLERMRARIVELREVGYRLAIDDLGAGYAGLNAFAALEPEVVKLDMSLIRDIDQVATKRKIVRAMSALCHDLGIRVVAEGIETRAELDVLVDAGCDLFQGYLFARPGPPFPRFSWPLK